MIRIILKRHARDASGLPTGPATFKTIGLLCPELEQAILNNYELVGFESVAEYRADQTLPKGIENRMNSRAIYEQWCADRKKEASS